ncbi:MAG: cysteine ABC transporter substrate-binding protein [Campylobacter sp.]|nr:cysteine ABC transporter substrate-binding protein [Campylobacter sp.]
MKKFLSLFIVAFALFFTGCSGGSESSNNASNTTNTNEATSSDNASSEAKAKKTSLDTIKERGFVKIGVFGDKPPFGYIDADGNNAGYDIYFAKRIAKELLGDENKVEFTVVEAANRVEFILSNKVDIILANFTVTPERKEVVDFALPYMKVSLGIASVDGNITDVSELEGKNLLVNKGTTADIFFTKNYPNIHLTKFDQNTETFAAMKDKRGDAIAHDNTLLFAWVKENPEFKVGVTTLGGIDTIAPAVKKGDEALKNWLDELIIKLGKEQFFHKDYDTTAKEFYTDDINPDDVVIEGGKI